MSGKALLEINHMSKKFGELEVIRDISLSVHEGEVVSIIGPSGSVNPPCFVVQRCLKKWTAVR